MTTSNMTMTHSNELYVQNCGKRCLTAQRRTIRRTLLYILGTLVCIAVVAFTYSYFHPAIFAHPDFDASAVAGVPEVGEERGYAALTVQNDYVIRICGAPEVEDNEVFFYVTNPAENDVWFRAEVLNSDGDVIGSSGVLKQGEYLPSIHLSEELAEGVNDALVRIVGYQPNTWQSKGNVNLQMVLKNNP